MIKRRYLAVCCVLFIALLILAGGCNGSLSKMFQSDTGNEEDLLKVKIYFTDGEALTTYIKGLAVQKEGRVYVGGSSLNYLYDIEGNVIGTYNYQRVLYILIQPEKTEAQ